ncbi:MAG: ribosomal protein S18-alanine N-acetyltransferase [Candidatus Limnocylindria bacterium]
MAIVAPVAIAPMRFEDIPAVHAIERLSFRSPWPAYAFEQELRGNRMARYLVARVGDEVTAFAGLWLMVDEAHITTFSVHPAWRRQGIGRQLLLSMLELGRALGAARMTLEVRLSNLAAQALYHGMGFTVAGQRTRYYTDDGEDALVMTTSELAGPAMQAVIATERARWSPPSGGT